MKRYDLFCLVRGEEYGDVWLVVGPFERRAAEVAVYRRELGIAPVEKTLAFSTVWIAHATVSGPDLGL
jgi:hypothetical protein